MQDSPYCESRNFQAINNEPEHQLNSVNTSAQGLLCETIGKTVKIKISKEIIGIIRSILK